MIQDIAPHKLNNQYDPLAVPEQEDYVLFFDGGRLLMKAGENKELLRVKDFPESCEFVCLFSLDDDRFFLLWEENTIPEGCEFVDVRTLRGNPSFPGKSSTPSLRENTCRTGIGTHISAGAAVVP